MSQIQTVLITGATGKQGGSAIKQLLKTKKVSIKALTRNPESSSAKKLTEQGVHVVKGSYDEPETLVKALQGVDAAYLVTDNSSGVESASRRSGKDFIDACKEAGVKHVVFSSVAGADDNSGVPHFESKWRIEKYLEASGLDYTMLRPVAFFDNLPKRSALTTFAFLGLFEAALQGKRLKWIATDDIGVFATRALEDPEQHKSKIYELASEDLSVKELKGAYAKVQGFTPWMLWLPSFVINWLPHDFERMLHYFRVRGFQTDVAEARRLYPEMMTAEQWMNSSS